VYDWLLLNGVDVTRNHSTVGQEVKPSADHSSYAAEPHLPLAELTESCAGCALNLASGEIAEELSLLARWLGQSLRERHSFCNDSKSPLRICRGLILWEFFGKMKRILMLRGLDADFILRILELDSLASGRSVV
jgi:hypothetical protein